MGSVIEQEIAEQYAIYNADCMSVLPGIKDEVVGLSIYSPPFPELYQYSNDPRDMSNCTTYEEGVEQYRFIVNEIHRVTMPGRLSCVHCMDLKKGGTFQRDFPGDIVKIHEDAGFNFFCRITIWKDPWLIARRTRMRSLMHKTLIADSSKVRVAGPDYVLVFKKSGDSPQAIGHPHGLKKYAGESDVPEVFELADGECVPSSKFIDYKGDQRKNLLSHWIFRQYASPVWTDIRSGRLLPYKQARENEEEKHVCPLQLDVIERCLILWSNPGDTVLTPFMGVGSEVYEAVATGRRAIGIELKSTYYQQAKQNVKSATTEVEDQRQFEFPATEETGSKFAQTMDAEGQTAA